MRTSQEGKTEKPANDIRIGMDSRVKNVIRYCNGLLKEKAFTFLLFSAVGGAIGKWVDAVEILKVVNPGLYQSNKLATVSYQSVDDEHKTVTNQRLYPKMEVILSLEAKEKNEGYQDKLKEEERLKLYDLFNQKPVRRTFNRARGSYRGRGYREERGSRGNRGGGGFRGKRVGPRRGGFRGNRGARNYY